MLVLGTSGIVMLLFYLLELANSFPSHFIKPSIAANDFIKHYEFAFYNAEDVANQHKRFRRATTSAKANSNQPLKFTIETSNKVFKLVLRPDEYLFADDVVFEGENGKVVNFDPSKVYIGTLEDDERTKVRGIITKDGLFDGTISTQFEEFYIEPISRYKENWNYNTGHTIVYKTSDVNHPNTPLCSCSSNLYSKHKPLDLNTIAHRSKRNAKSHTLSNSWPKFDNLLKRVAAPSTPSPESSKNASKFMAFHPIPLLYDFPYVNYGPAETAKMESRADSVHHNHHHHHSHHRQNTSPKNSDDNMFYDFDVIVPKPPVQLPPPSPSPLPPHSPDDQNFNYDYNDTIIHLSNSKANWRSKTSGGPIDTVFKYTANVSKTSKGNQPSSASVIPHKNNPKILVGSGGGGFRAEESRANLIITSDDSSESHAHKRAIVDPKKTTCMLYLQADHLFFEKYGTEETCIEVMTRHVQRVNSIYRNTDFNLDGKADNISFMIKRIKVHSAKDPTYRFPGNYGVEKFLEIFSEEDYDTFCLAYMFTYRDFEMGTLGLAWTGDLKNAGGVCEKNGHYRGSLKSLNTGIVTVLNYGKHVPSAVSHVTLAHEIGHNFGSPHDPDGCTPGGDDGNFIMFARATSGDKRNNNKFSPCSLNAINPVLNVKARSPKGCFTEPQKSICGNGVVEADEECDCGWEEDCKDSCCYPQRRYPPLDETPCHLTPNAVCSPSQGPCCTTDCKIKSGDICRSDNGCRDSSYCNGISAQCPPSTNKPNKTVCNEEYVCYMGECTGSICLAYGLESCQCIPTASDLPTKACELCCKLPGENQPCLSSFQWNQAPYDVPDMFAKPGTPCNDYNGYCDVFRKCREVDPSGPIATLRKLLLSEENIASFKKWAYDHWYYCGLIFLTFLLFMILSTKVLGKKSKVKSITVVHSSPTETVRLPDGDGAGSGPAVVVHPTAVRTKLPLKKKVREKRRAANNNAVGADENVPHNVNNNNSPIEAKKKKRDVKNNAKAKTKLRTRKNMKKDSQAAGAAAASHIKGNAPPTEDPLGKVRNWLINSHNMDSLGSLKKSKSSPASFDLSEANSVGKRQKVQSVAVATAAAAATVAVKPTLANVTKTADAGKAAAKKPKDTRVKLQVVYKPPFKFSLKLGKQKNEISSHLIKDKRPDAVKQRAALLIRADRIRANAVTSNDKGRVQSKSKNVSGLTPAENDNNVLEGGDESTVADSGGAKPGSRAVEYKRSISAPQSTEPLYENTVFENATAAIADLKQDGATANSSFREPHYVNLVSAEQKTKNDSARTKHWPNGESASRNFPVAHPSSSAIKRSCSNDFRSSLSKPSSSNVANCRTFTKRRNSYDTKHVVANKLAFSDITSDCGEPIVEYVKRQHSNDSDVLSTAVRNEFKRKSAPSIRRTSSGDAKSGANLSRSHQPRKSTSYRKSYHDRSSSSVSPFVDTSKSDARNKKLIQQQQQQQQQQPSNQADYNLISFGSPSFDRLQPKRKTSYDATAMVQDSLLDDPFGKNGSRGHVTRATSHSTRRKTEGDKFKRYSLQNAAEAATVSSGAAPKANAPSLDPADTRFSVNAAQCAESPFHQQQYDVPSDLEVLLSESENPIGV